MGKSIKSGKIIGSILHLQENVFFCLHDFLGPQRHVYLKLEGLNPAGSIKFKPARYMMQDLEERGIIQPGRNKILESSSGNLGVALALVCKVKGYQFTCITDPNANPEHLAHICIAGFPYFSSKVEQDDKYIFNTV